MERPYTHIGIQYLIGISISLLILGITEASIYFFPNVGLNILYVPYILIPLGLIAFYYLTFSHSTWWSIFSFIINFIAWVAEQVNTEFRFGETVFYRGQYSQFNIMVLGALFWVTNKVLLDLLIHAIKSRNSRNKISISSETEIYEKHTSGAGWYTFGNGKTIGQSGSEGGYIIEDIEYHEGARITIEKDAGLAPHAITLGIYGLLFHTKLVSTSTEVMHFVARTKALVESLFIHLSVAKEMQNELWQTEYDRLVDEICENR